MSRFRSFVCAIIVLYFSIKMSQEDQELENTPSTYPVDTDPCNWNSCDVVSPETQTSLVWGRLFPLAAFKDTDVIELQRDVYTFGRKSTCDVVFSQNMSKDHLQHISKVHFKITRSELASVFVVYLEDLSINGTFVNNKKVGKGNKVPLMNNDLISLAKPYIKAFAFTNCLRDQYSYYPEDVLKKYVITKELGAGSCGEVRLAWDKVSGKALAMKIIHKNAYSNGSVNDPSKIMNEIKILRALSHPCIIRIEDCFDTPENCFMVLTLAEGGDLMKCIMDLQHLSEKEAKQIFYQVVLAVQYLHSKGITHRDLKPQNILLATKGPNALIKVADFGLSKSFERLGTGPGFSDSGRIMFSEGFRSVAMQTVCGTPLYVAPEILEARDPNTGGYTHMVDIWSMGVVLYVCLSGCPPFLPSSSYEQREISESSSLGEGTTRSVTNKWTLPSAILAGDYCFPKRLWNNVSDAAVDIIRKMLTVDPKQRITTREILEHPWMKDEEMIFQVQSLMNAHHKRHFHECCGDGSSSECEPQSRKRRQLMDGLPC